MAKSLPTTDGVLAGIAVGTAIPAFHRLHGNSVRDLDPSARERFRERRVGAGNRLGIAWNLHS
ncbi:MAG: hypothetical protein AUG74_13110 [Bacteroidetes bacterium 13_1_20CM_4_60_6]|nr:MAG: hypothetical protein AUG74_13110 [Bacteroidetes bacterium 13_1_20CM_4_60_6]